MAQPGKIIFYNILFVRMNHATFPGRIQRGQGSEIWRRRRLGQETSPNRHAVSTDSEAQWAVRTLNVTVAGFS